MKRFTSTLPAFANVPSSRSPYTSLVVSPEPVEGSNHEQSRPSFDRPVLSKGRIRRQAQGQRRVDWLRMSVRQNGQSRHTSTYFVVAVAVAVAVVSAVRPQYGGTLRVDTQAVVRTLDPVTATNDAAG